MKPPRWLAKVLLLFTAAAVAGFAVWWIVWPVMTGREFVSLLRHDEFDQADRRFGDRSVGFSDMPEIWQGGFRGTAIDWDSPTVTDVLAGRRRFQIECRVRGIGFGGVLQFTVEHGRIYGGEVVSDSP